MKGSCHCGAITFKVSGKPDWVGACYCVDCRKISGSPYTVFAGYKKEDVEITQGTPQEYASSKTVVRLFCPTCGSPFAYVYTDPQASKLTFIPVGIFDDPGNFKIEQHIWVSQKLSWVHISDDAPQRAD